MVETIGDYEQYTAIYKIKREFEEKNELINELKKQIEQLKKRNYNLKCLLLCKLPAYLNAAIECL